MQYVNGSSASKQLQVGCVYEAIVQFNASQCRTTIDDYLYVVLFDNITILALEMREMKEDKVGMCLQYVARRVTNYSSGVLL